MIPDESVEEVRARADIVEVVGEVVPLKRSGKDFKGKCPFHDDRTPSFYVVPAKGFYTCFGCGESGDVFTFLMKRQGLEFVDAVKQLGARYGVDVREVRGTRPEEDPYRPLYEANAFARDFFKRMLWEEPQGEPARAYLEKREIPRETAERFELGFAPDGWHALREAAATHEMDDEVLIEVGLLIRNERRTDPYDRFRNRLVFPIEGVGGQVVGFGGRVIAAKGSPKYVNSPESPIYHKGETLYGLNWARNEIRRRESALVVEGYMDVVALGAVGIDNVVATLGTAMTEEHARLIKRYTTRVYLLFDSDQAGLKATFRAGDALLTEGLQPSVVTLPPGEDPDSIVRREGSAAMAAYLDQAVDVLDRKIQILEERGYFESIEKRRTAVDRLLPTLRAAADPTLRDLYVSRVASRTGVRPETLEQELVKGPERPASRPPTRAPRPRGPRVPRMGAERQLLLVLVKNRDWIEAAAEQVGPDDFVDAGYRAVFELLIREPELRHVSAEIDSTTARRLEELLGNEEELAHGGRVLSESLARIRGAALDRRLEGLDRQIALADDEDRVRDLLSEKARLTKERREVGLDWSVAARKTLRAGVKTPIDEAGG
jgi:DNA primase